MFALVILSLLSALASSSAVPVGTNIITSIKDGQGTAISKERIVGGTLGDITNFKFLVVMRYNGVFRCGGTIIGPKHVVTAAHCTDGILAINITIKAGSSFLESTDGLIRRVTNAFIHTNYNAATQDYDLSILKLEEDLPIGSLDYNINAIALPDATEPLVTNNVVRVAGWGTITSGGSTSNQLRYVDVTVVSKTSCQLSYLLTATITDQMFCAGGTLLGGKDSCQGDSGGPVTYNNKLHGAVSFGTGCGVPTIPGVYTRISSLRVWIDLTILL